MSTPSDNPKLQDSPVSNAEKDPSDWVTGDEDITGAQASYVKTLAEEAHEEVKPSEMTKAEASIKIDELRTQLGKDE